MLHLRRDLASPLDERIDPRTGALTVRYAPTWIGVREYANPDGTVSRELHRPEQVNSPGFRAQIAHLPIPLSHPETPSGDPIWLLVDPSSKRCPPGYVPGAVRDYAVGWTSQVEDRPCVEWPSLLVPTVSATYTDQSAIDLLRSGVSQSSLGYCVWIDRTPGVWIAPDGSEHPYDAEHVLDPADPRIAAAIEAGELSPSEALFLGPNHLACLPRGRGGLQSVVRLDGAIPLREGLGDPLRFYLRRDEDVHGKSGTGRVADGVLWPDGTSTIRWRTETASTTNFDRLADLEAIHGHEGRTPIVWIDSAPEAPEIPAGVRLDSATAEAPTDLAALARSAPRHPYKGLAAGWEAWSQGDWGVAFWAPTGQGLLWKDRGPSGGVRGAPLLVPAKSVPTSDEGPLEPPKIAGVTRTRITLPPEVRRDGMVSFEVEDDPAVVSRLEAIFSGIAGDLGAMKSALGEAQAQNASLSEANEDLAAQVAELAPMAELGATLDREVAAERARLLGQEPRGDSGPAIREAVVTALSPAALSRYKAGSPERRVAADAAFDVLFAARSAAASADPAPQAGTRRLQSDAAPAPGSASTNPNPAASRRFNVEA